MYFSNCQFGGIWFNLYSDKDIHMPMHEDNYNLIKFLNQYNLICIVKIIIQKKIYIFSSCLTHKFEVEMPFVPAALPTVLFL